MARVLTAAAVERYRPGPARREIPDGGAPGLYLVVQPGGAKVWAMRFRRPSGAPCKVTLGPVDLSGREMPAEPVVGQPLTLAGARRLATQVHRDRAMGLDVVVEYRARRQRRQAAVEDAAANTYAVAARRYIDEHARTKTRRWRETARVLGLIYPRDGGEPTVARGGLAERWRDRPVRDLSDHDAWSVVDEARRTGIPGIRARSGRASEPRARGLYAALSSFFGWLVRNRVVERNPCAGVHRPPAPPDRERELSSAEIVAFWRACGALSPPFGQALKLLLLTGCRLREVSGMRRAELAGDGESWTIPGARTKNRKPHWVPLAPLAREILAEVPSDEDCELVFTTTGRTPISGWSKTKRELDESMDAVPPWRLHDLRRTVVTQMAELGVRPDVIELCVNHLSGHRSGVAGVYNRSELRDERRAALERWAAHVHGLVNKKSAKVVPLRRRERQR